MRSLREKVGRGHAVGRRRIPKCVLRACGRRQRQRGRRLRARRGRPRQRRRRLGQTHHSRLDNVGTIERDRDDRRSCVCGGSRIGSRRRRLPLTCTRFEPDGRDDRRKPLVKGNGFLGAESLGGHRWRPGRRRRWLPNGFERRRRGGRRSRGLRHRAGDAASSAGQERRRARRRR
jgi:hypothetical protein